MVMVLRMRRPILAGRKLITTVKKNRTRVESVVLKAVLLSMKSYVHETVPITEEYLGTKGLLHIINSVTIQGKGMLKLSPQETASRAIQ